MEPYKSFNRWLRIDEFMPPKFKRQFFVSGNCDDFSSTVKECQETAVMVFLRQPWDAQYVLRSQYTCAGFGAHLF